MTERRKADRLDDRELTIDVQPNRAGGVMARVVHLPSRRCATSTHREHEIAVRQAKRELARLVTRGWRKRAR